MRDYIQYSASAGELASISMIAFMVIMFAITWRIVRASKSDVSRWENIHLDDGVQLDNKKEEEVS